MRTWTAHLKDKGIVEENIEKPNWLQVQNQVSHLELNNNGQIITLPDNMEQYVQGKTASGDLISGKCQIESRYIGFYYKGVKITIRIDEKSNNISVGIND
jgi:hypothetical protein